MDGGLELTWSRISIHSAASDGSKAKMNVRPSFDDKILPRVLIDSAPSTTRTFFHSSLGEVDADFICGKLCEGCADISPVSFNERRSEENQDPELTVCHGVRRWVENYTRKQSKDSTCTIF